MTGNERERHIRIAAHSVSENKQLNGMVLAPSTKTKYELAFEGQFYLVIVLSSDNIVPNETRHFNLPP